MLVPLQGIAARCVPMCALELVCWCRLRVLLRAWVLAPLEGAAECRGCSVLATKIFLLSGACAGALMQNRKS